MNAGIEFIERECLWASWRAETEALVNAIEFCRCVRGHVVARHGHALVMEFHATPAQLDAVSAILPREGLMAISRERRHRVPHFVGMEGNPQMQLPRGGP